MFGWLRRKFRRELPWTLEATIMANEVACAFEDRVMELLSQCVGEIRPEDIHWAAQRVYHEKRQRQEAELPG
jgi:hypothetical protein